MTIEFVRASSSPQETRLIGESLGVVLRAGDVVLLSGELGAGKTGLVRGIAAGMGVGDGAVCSPTYVLMHEYTGTSGPGLVHIDGYRLADADEFGALGLDRVFGSDASGALVVEWPERLPPGVIDSTTAARVRIDQVGEDRRELWFALPESWLDRPGLDALRQREPTVCPITGKPVPAGSPTWPFFDERARLADLYRWLSSAHSIGRDMDADDLDET